MELDKQVWPVFPPIYLPAGIHCIAIDLQVFQYIIYHRHGRRGGIFVFLQYDLSQLTSPLLDTWQLDKMIERDDQENLPG